MNTQIYVIYLSATGVGFIISQILESHVPLNCVVMGV
jgi:hypothetical protein